MPLSNNQQAIVLFISALLIALGAYAAAIPQTIPEPYRYIIAGILFLAGAIGFALKEAAGGTPPASTNK